MHGILQATTTTTSTKAFSRRRHPRVAAGLLAIAMLAIAACGGSDTDTGTTASSSQSDGAEASENTDTAAAGEAAAPASSVDLAPISDCIAAADIVVAPTTFSDSFMAEQGLSGVLDLGALGNEFGGGQLFFYQSMAGADDKYSSLTNGGTDAVVRQDGTTVLEYRSAVQDEAADAIMGCIG